MEIEEYKGFMRSLSNSARRIGLSSNGIYRCKYEESGADRWAITVSRKTELNNMGVLYSGCNMLSNKLNFPIVVCSKADIERYTKKAEEEGADFFTKYVIARQRFIQPSPQFMKLDKVKQAVIFFHEAYHSTPKYFWEMEVPYNSTPDREEASAVIAGHLGAINHFKGTDLEGRAEERWKKHLGLAEIIKGFYCELEDMYTRLSGHEEETMRERKEVFKRAEENLGNESALGGPINNAFFLYWNHFYGAVPSIYQEIGNPKHVDEVISALRRR